MNADDREFILNILNYDMQPIFAALGFDTAGGEFIYARKDRLDPTTNLQIVQGLHSIGLPMDDDWLYETFSIQKPENYDEIKAQREAERAALQQALNAPMSDKQDENNKENRASERSSNTVQKSLKNRLSRFFSLAPTTGADTDF